MAFRFFNFPVYQKSREFYRDICNLTKKFPIEEKYILVSQIKRAALSIILNIAEGSDRGSDKDFNRYLIISLGSLNEVMACLDIALNNNYIIQEDFRIYYKKATELSNQLAGFSRKLKNS